jgi:hypothetical protein
MDEDLPGILGYTVEWGHDGGEPYVALKITTADGDGFVHEVHPAEMIELRDRLTDAIEELGYGLGE